MSQTHYVPKISLFTNAKRRPVALGGGWGGPARVNTRNLPVMTFYNS
jgi:hypothetical protein